METLNLLMICVAAFIAVFTLLSLLAILMKVILIVFPANDVVETDGDLTDSAVIAAVTTVVTSMYPGTQVTNVEEQP